MIYTQEILIPANTLPTDPLIAEVAVVQGVVRRVWIRWRWGSADLAGCSIYRGAFQVWPTSGFQWFPSTTLDTAWDEDYPLGDEPLQFTIKSYNLDELFSPMVWVAFSVQRRPAKDDLIVAREFYESGVPL